MRDLQVFFNPCDEVILERSLDGLMKEVGGEKFIYICSGEVCRKRLGSRVSTRSGEGDGQPTRKSGTIPWPNHSVSSSSVSRSMNISSRVRSSAAGSSRFEGSALQLERRSSVHECREHQGMYRRDTPPVYSPCSSRLLRIVRNFRAKTVDGPAEVVVRASNEVPLQHIRFDSGVDDSQAAMEETTAEIAEDFVLHIIPSACGVID